MVHVFIVNPFAGRKNFADNLREKLKNIDGIEYYIFISRYAGHETVLAREVREIFDEDKIRIYCCGGSGTLKNIISGIDNFDDIEIASFPCGMTNDFLKMFSEEKRFGNIEELINGEIIDIDYIKATEGVALNTFSLGLDTAMSSVMDELTPLQIISESLPYLLGVIYGIIISKPSKYIIETEFGTFDTSVTEFFFGNGNVLGGSLRFFENTYVSDGKANIRIIKTGRGVFCIPYLIACMKNDQKFLNEKSIHGMSSFVKIRSKNGKKFSVNFDGELNHDLSEWKAEIVKKGLHFVVPKGVRLKDE